MLLETFYKDRTKTLCTGPRKRILIHNGPMDRISYKGILVYLVCSEYNEINIYFWHGKNLVNY